MIKCFKMVLACIMAMLLTGCQKGERQMIVGDDIVIDDITEFYYTYSSSTYPPEYQRYYFYVDNHKYYYYHETREGNAFPLTEDYITVSGTKELSQDEWNTFFAYLKDGTVRSRQENADSGDSGPWTYLYWKKDKGKYQEFTFRDWDTQTQFEEYCIGLKNE